MTELFQVLPALLFAMVLVTLFTPSLQVVIFAIGLVAWTGTARLARAEFMRLRGMEYVSAARAMGAGPLAIMLREILPNALPPLIVLGLADRWLGDPVRGRPVLPRPGAAPNVMSWGMMIGAAGATFSNAGGP